MAACRAASRHGCSAGGTQERFVDGAGTLACSLSGSGSSGRERAAISFHGTARPRYSMLTRPTDRLVTNSFRGLNSILRRFPGEALSAKTFLQGHRVQPLLPLHV